MVTRGTVFRYCNASSASSTGRAPGRQGQEVEVRGLSSERVSSVKSAPPFGGESGFESPRATIASVPGFAVASSTGRAPGRQGQEVEVRGLGVQCVRQLM